MNKAAFTSIAVLASVLATSAPTSAQIFTNRGIYQIVAGTSFQEGGFGGDFSWPLPTSSEAFVSVSSDLTAHSVQLRFFDRNLRPGFTLTNGVILGNRVRFLYSTPLWGPFTNTATIDYEVVTNGDTLSINGSVNITYDPCCICNDCITRYGHIGVSAILTPPVTIRRLTDRVELCWSTTPNRIYQVRYKNDLTTNTWTNLGSLIWGTGSTVCIQDTGLINQQQRFYRIALP